MSKSHFLNLLDSLKNQRQAFSDKYNKEHLSQDEEGNPLSSEMNFNYFKQLKIMKLLTASKRSVEGGNTLGYYSATAEELERILKEKKQKYLSSDLSFNEISNRKYVKLVDNLKHLTSNNDSRDAFADELSREAKIMKKLKRRATPQGKEISYINNRNFRFNEKVSRFYDSFTEEMRLNLDRGSSL